MATFTVSKINFLEWYYNCGSDQEQESMRNDLGDFAIEQLIAEGEVKITADDIFAECEITCMPCSFLNEFPDDYEGEIGDEDSIDIGVDEILLVD